MDFVLAKSGTITECREALNDAIRDISSPARTQEETVVRAIASYVVQELLDPPHALWADEVNKANGVHLRPPAEPTCGFAITCTIALEHPQ